jgi:hypothetical protein
MSTLPISPTLRDADVMVNVVEAGSLQGYEDVYVHGERRR